MRKVTYYQPELNSHSFPKLVDMFRKVNNEGLIAIDDEWLKEFCAVFNNSFRLRVVEHNVVTPDVQQNLTGP